jgi:hypothetical protein
MKLRQGHWSSKGFKEIRKTKKEENQQGDRVELSQESKKAYANYAILSTTLKGNKKTNFTKVVEGLKKETAAKFISITANLQGDPRRISSILLPPWGGRAKMDLLI